jgi:hypothetical protein
VNAVLWDWNGKGNEIECKVEGDHLRLSKVINALDEIYCTIQ